MCLSDTEKCFQTQKRLNNPPLIGAPKCRDGNKKQSRNGGAMCLSDTEKVFQTQKRLNNPSLIGAPKCRDGIKNSLGTEVQCVFQTQRRFFRRKSG